MCFVGLVFLWKEFLKLLTVWSSVECILCMCMLTVFAFYIFHQFHNFCYVGCFYLLQTSSFSFLGTSDDQYLFIWRSSFNIFLPICCCVSSPEFLFSKCSSLESKLLSSSSCMWTPVSSWIWSFLIFCFISSFSTSLIIMIILRLCLPSSSDFSSTILMLLYNFFINVVALVNMKHSFPLCAIRIFITLVSCVIVIPVLDNITTGPYWVSLVWLPFSADFWLRGCSLLHPPTVFHFCLPSHHFPMSSKGGILSATVLLPCARVRLHETEGHNVSEVNIFFSLPSTPDVPTVHQCSSIHLGLRIFFLQIYCTRSTVIC
jgi:hypothetical protein